MQPLNVDRYAQGLMILCAGHRSRYGIKQPPKRNDCELKPCRTGCPIKIMKEGNRKWMLNRNVAVNQRNTYSQIQEECTFINV